MLETTPVLKRRILMRVRSGLMPAGPQVEALQSKAYRFRRQSDTLALAVNDEEYKHLIQHPAVEVYPDVQLQPSLPYSPLPQWTSVLATAATPTLGLPEVLQRIKAPAAWNKSRGKDTFIAIFDSGVCGSMLEFPDWKKAAGWSFDGSDPWIDYLGHGSMVACVAAATDADGGRYNGVAPDAKLYSCKTQYLTSQLIDAYEWLMDRREEHDLPIIANNSYDFTGCSNPNESGLPITINHPFVSSLQQAILAGITVIFAAGNNHSLCHGDPQQCQPDTIWIWNSLGDVLSVGTIDQNDDLWDYSSRGPGQWASPERTKPDCVAPTYGEVMAGCSYQNFANGWGTSGAAPQAAGLAALLLSQDPSSAPANVLDRIRQTCDPHPSSSTCSGHGVINCERALSSEN